MCRFASAAVAVEFEVEADRLIQEVLPLCSLLVPALSNQLRNDALDHVTKLKLLCRTFATQLDLILFSHQKKRPTSNFTDLSERVLAGSFTNPMVYVHAARALYGILVVILSGFHPVPITTDIDSRTTKCYTFVFHQLDPALRQQVELELYAEQLKNVETKQRAHSILSRALFGEFVGISENTLSTTNKCDQHPFLSAFGQISRNLRQAIRERQQNFMPYRPASMALATFLQLKADISDYFGATVSDVVESSLTGFVTSSIAALQRIAAVDNFGLANTDFEDDFVRWRKLTYNFIDNVLQPFSTPYNDLVMPLATGLHDTMDSLSALLQMQSSEKTAPLASVPPMMPLLNSYQTSQFYLKRAMQFLRPTTAAQNDDLTMQLLCMSSLGEQLQTSCLKSDISQARHMQSKIICQLIKRWTQACDDVRAKRAEQQQLFKVKHSTKPEEQDLQTAYAERDRIAEESDYRQAFPSYEKDYADLRSATPVATRKNFGNNVESVSGDADSEREQAVRALSQHEKDVQSLMTLSDRFIRFTVECDAFGHCRELLACKSQSHVTASKNAAFAAYNFYTRHAATLSTTENDSALAALYFQASMLLRHSSLSNVQNNNVNFYHDADTNIALRSASIINSFSMLFDQLEKPEELGGISLSARHPVVDHLRKIFQRILEIPVASSAPVQFAVGLQLVVESVQSLLQQIPRAAGLHARVDELVQFLFELRKLELTSWQQSLRSRRGELENRAYSWYFSFYTLLEDETTALAAVADDEKETAKKSYEFAQSILTLIDASPLVEFQPRLFVLDVVIQRARWQQFSMPVTDKPKSVALAKIINILINIFMLYKQYESLVGATIERCPDSDAAKAVKELKDYLKICRYDNRNFWAMRESIEKSRRLVHRCVRKYEVFLMSRALDWTAAVENQKTPVVINDSGEHQQRRESKITVDTRLFDSSSASLLRYVTRANEFAEKIDSTTTCRTELLHQRSSRFVTHAHGRLEKLQGLRFEDLIDKAKMPAEVEGSGNNKEKKAALKQIKTERRRAARAIRRQKVDALHDLFAVLQHLGVSHRKGLLVSSDDLLIAALKCSTITAKTTELPIIKAANDLYYAVLADFGKFRARSMQRIADERLRASISPFIESMRGCAHHAMWLAVKQRAHIVKLANAVISLERVDELLMPFSEAVAAPESNSLLIRQAEFRKLYNLAGGFLSTCTATINELSTFTTTCYKAAQHESDDDATYRIMADVADIKFVPSVQLASTLEKVDKVFASLCAEAKQICAEFSSYSDDVSQSSFIRDAEDNAPPIILSAMHLHSLEKAVILGRQLSQLKDVRCVLSSTVQGTETDAIGTVDAADEPPFVWLNNTLNAAAESSSIFVQKYDAVNVNEAIAEEAVSQQKLSFDAAELNKKLVQPVMLAIESAYKSASALPNESSEDDADSGLLSNRYVSEIEIPLEALGIDNVVPYCNSLTAANKHSSLEQLRLLAKTLPVVQLYAKILQAKLEQTIAVHERTCATLKFSIHAFSLILQRGFCEPYDLLAEDSDDENEDDGKSKQKKLQKDDDLNSDQLINEQAGIGDGIGLNDVSDQIKSEDEMKQLLDAEEKPLESNESRQEKGAAEKESDKAVEMKEHNFEGEYFDEEENAANAEDGESADKHKEKPENDEAHREMGELGDGLHDVLNDGIWSDDKEESEEEKNKDTDKKPLAQESNAAGGEGKPLEENEQEQMLDETAAETAENQQTAAAAAAKNQQNAAGNGENAETAAADQTMADDGDENESDAAAPQQPIKLPETGDAEGEENRTADEITADDKNKVDTDADADNDDDIDMTDANDTNGLRDESEQSAEAEEEKEDADGFTDQSVKKQQTLDENETADDDKLQALPLGGSADQTDAEKQNDAEQQQQNAARGAYGGLQAANETNEQQQNGGRSAEDAQNDENDANDVDGGNQTQMAESEAGGQNPANKFAQQRRQFPSEKSSLPQKRSAMPPPASEAGRRSLASKNEIESGATPPKRAKILHADKNNSTRSNEQPSVSDADMYQHLNNQDEKPIESTPTLAVDVATQEEAEKSREQKLPPEAFDDTDADVEKTGLDVDEDVQMEEINAVEKLLATRTLKSTVPKTGDETATEDAARTDNNADDGEMNDTETSSSAVASSYAKRSDASGLFFTQLDNIQAQAEARERLLAEIVEKMNSLPQPTPTTENENSEEAETNRLQHAARLWQLYEQLTAPLARELCEQLRLVLEPTLRGKLRGDFRTGKRLNVRRIISYIASDFRKDKIWLRRAQPSKRHYQVMLAVDDSQSMAELKTRTMAFEALATLSNALTWLEAGELGVCKFGEQFEMLHELNGAPFTTESACRVLARCQFSQRNTRIVQLVDSTMAVFDAARSRIQQQAGGGGGGLVSQLLLIVSDGHNIFADGEERVLSSVRAAVSTPGVCIVYIVLRNPTHNVSVLDMKRSVFDKDNKVTLTNYMDDFPFPLYVILNDSSDLPGVLGDAIKQWFEMLVSEGV